MPNEPVLRWVVDDIMEFPSAPIPWRYAGGGVIHDANDNFTIYLAGRLSEARADDIGRLVAAAPEMYQALLALLEEVNYLQVRAALAALAKASGARTRPPTC